MRLTTFTLASVLLASSAGLVHADEERNVFATREVHLRERPGETGDIVGVADTGEKMTVLGHHGRWLHVRHGRRVGWVTRTEVDAHHEQPEPPRDRAEKSGFSGKPHEDALKVTVVIDRVRGFDDPDTKANCVLDLARGDTVSVIGRGHDGWILVEPAEGAVGWIPAVAVTDGGRFAGDPRRAPSEVPVIENTPTGTAPAPAAVTTTAAATPATKGKAKAMRKGATVVAAATPAPAAADSATVTPAATASADASAHAIIHTGGSSLMERMDGNVMAGAGAETFAMRMVGGSGDALALTTGPAAAMAASGRYRVAGDIWVGGGLDGQFGKGSLTYYTAAATSDPMSTTDTTVDAHAEVAWGKTWKVAARAGYHYAALNVSTDRTDAMLVGEKIGGMTVGVGGSLPINQRFAVTGAIDIMPAGVQSPDQLPKGLLYATSMQAAWARTTVTVKLPANLVGALSYRGGIASADLTDGAATPVTAKRSDQSHIVTAGVGLTW
jgi:hypothetical protein